MAEPEVKFRYDYKDPENVKSKVPGEQKLRESIETSELAIAKSSVGTGDKVVSPGDYVLTPVVTVIKNEEIKNGVFITLKPPVYPEIQSDVLHNPEAIRSMGDHIDEDKKRTRIPKLRFRQAVDKVKRERRASCEAENGVKKEIKNGVFITLKPPVYPEIQSDVLHNPEAIRSMGDHIDEDKKRTRIPKLRFRQAVDKVKRERRASCEAENGVKKAPNPMYQRRSSIPRLKKFASVDNGKSENPVITTLEDDDEFEKIYDEVVTDSVSIDETILNTKVDDPVKLEHRFEEIIHAYDDNKVQPLSIEKPKHSKIPMLKRRSEQEIEVPKNLGKTYESIPSPGRLKVQDVINKYSKIRDEESNSKRRPVKTDISMISDEKKTNDGTKNYLKEVHANLIEEIPSEVTHNIKIENISNQPIHSEVITYNTKVNTKNNNKTNNVSYNTIEVFEEKAPIYNETIELLPVKETSVVEIINTKENVPIKPVKMATVEELNLITQNLLNNSEYTIQYNVKEESNSIPINSLIEVDVTDNNENNTDDIKEEIIIEEVNLDNDKLDNTEDEIPLIKGQVSKIIRQLSLNPENKEDAKLPLHEELPKTKSVLSKIAMFERSAPTSIPKPREYKSSNIKPVSPFTEEDRYTPKVVNGTLKFTNEFDPNWDDNKKHTISYERTPYEENNIIHNVTTREVNVSSSTIVDVAPTAEENTFEDQPVVTKNEPYFPNDTVKIAKDSEEIEIQPIEPYTIEYAQPINIVESVPLDFEPKVNQISLNNNKDVVYMNYKNERSEVPDKRLYKSQVDLRSNKIEPTLPDNKVFKSKNIDKEEIKDDFRRFRSTSEDHRSQKTKSVADIDLGDTIRGKVHNMIVRINSSEKLNVEKKEVISAKERPRKKSVSEKIALFEGKFSVANTPTTTRLPTTKAQKPIASVSGLREEELNAKIAELEAARVKYGQTDGSKSIVLANGVEMPQIAIGTALLDPKLAVHIVSTAIKLGYRAIDTAYIYGNEREVGEAIRKKIEDGTVKREDLFITSKLWSTFHRTDLVEVACRRSLEAMGLEYFDLYLVHSPMSFKEGPDPLPKIANVLQYSCSHDYIDAWFGMEQLVPKQLARSVGVSNFNSQQLHRLLDKAKVKPVINQVECHPYLSQHKLDEFCAERNIKLMCYGVLGSKGTPMDLKGANNEVLEDPLVQVMAAGLGITPAQLLIRYQLEQGRAVAVKASTGAHLHENLQALSCSLTEGQVDAVSALNRNKRTFTFKGMGDTHKNYPFRAQF